MQVRLSPVLLVMRLLNELTTRWAVGRRKASGTCVAECHKKRAFGPTGGACRPPEGRHAGSRWVSSASAKSSRSGSSSGSTSRRRGLRFRSDVRARPSTCARIASTAPSGFLAAVSLTRSVCRTAGALRRWCSRSRSRCRSPVRSLTRAERGRATRLARRRRSSPQVPGKGLEPSRL